MRAFRASLALAGSLVATVLIIPVGVATTDGDAYSDDDTPGITVTPTSGLVTSEGGGTATFTVVLDAEPADEVTVDLVGSDTTEGTVSPASLSFTPSDWDLPQTVTVTGADDDLDDGDVGYLIVTGPAGSADAAYDGLDAADVSVTNVDDDGDSTDESQIIRVTMDSGHKGDGSSNSPCISADGRYVAFDSISNNLVPDDTNGFREVFIRDLKTGLTERVRIVDGSGNEEEHCSGAASISADGRYVAFDAEAADSVGSESGRGGDIFVLDRETGVTEMVSLSLVGGRPNGGSGWPSISADGRYVAFVSYASDLVRGDTNKEPDIFVHDRETGKTERVNISSSGDEANSWSFYPSISADGRFVAFESNATNLVPGDTNRREDIFVHDRESGRMEELPLDTRANEAHANGSSPSISADGRFVAFWSRRAALVSVSGERVWKSCKGVFVYDRETGITERIPHATGHLVVAGTSCPSVSADGRFVAFDFKPTGPAGDATGGPRQVIVHDRRTGRSMSVTVPSTSDEANHGDHAPSISADGRFVAFTRCHIDPVWGGLTTDVLVAPNPLAP